MPNVQGDPPPNRRRCWPGTFVDDLFHGGESLAGSMIDAIAYAEEVGAIALEQSPRAGAAGLQARCRGRTQECGIRLGHDGWRGVTQPRIDRKMGKGLGGHAGKLTAGT